MPSKIEELKEKKKELANLLKKEGKKALVDEFKAVFDQVPELESLVWQGYTPHFNDGDVCEYSVGEYSATFNVPVPDKEYVGYDNQTQKTTYKDIVVAPGDLIEEIGYDKGPSDPILKNTKAALKTLNKVKNELPEIFEAAFGDHAEVTATRKGFKVEVYEHD